MVKILYNDPTEPKDGDFAAYVERLTSGTAGSPGWVPPPAKGGRRAPASPRQAPAPGETRRDRSSGRDRSNGPGPATAGSTMMQGGAPGTGWGRSSTPGNADSLFTTPSAGNAPPDLDAALRQLRGNLRGGGQRLARWMMIVGIALIVLTLLPLPGFWGLSPVPGFLLIAGSLLIRKLSRS